MDETLQATGSYGRLLNNSRTLFCHSTNIYRDRVYIYRDRLSADSDTPPNQPWVAGHNPTSWDQGVD